MSENGPKYTLRFRIIGRAGIVGGGGGGVGKL